jgi:hypothetical protein
MGTLIPSRIDEEFARWERGDSLLAALGTALALLGLFDGLARRGLSDGRRGSRSPASPSRMPPFSSSGSLLLPTKR